MTTPAAELAEQFAQVAAQFARVVADLSPAQWRAFCPTEARTVAALAHHVAEGYVIELAAFQAMTTGAPVTEWTRAGLAEVNAADGATYAACDQAETVALLRANAAAAAAFVRGLTADQLARRGRYIVELPELSVAEWITRVLIGHPAGHLQSIRAAVGS